MTYHGRMGPISMRHIRMDREEMRLLRVAEERGYENTDSMIRDMYVVQGLSLKEIHEGLFTPTWSLRKRLARLNITLRGRGGANNVVTHITRELVEECSRDGIATVAGRLGVIAQMLSNRMKKWCEENAPDLLEVCDGNSDTDRED